jgi:hypothetical protein
MPHVLYTPGDFTPEEISRGNKLAEAVIEGGLSVCKKCGEYEAGLDAPCGGDVLVSAKNANIPTVIRGVFSNDT